MARIRTVKPEFFVSESLAEVSIYAERTFGGLITQVDDEGRYKDNAAILHGAIWALRPEHTAVDVEQDLITLAAAGLIHRYTVAGKRYLHLLTFNVHQKVSHPTPSKLPECPVCNGTADQDARTPADAGASPEGSDAPPQSSGFSPEPSGGSPLGSGVGVGSGIEVEREAEQTPPAAAPPRADKPRATRATAAPERFEITEGLAAWATEHHIPPEIQRAQTERFLDHHRSKGNTFKDWNAAWRTWMSRVNDYARASPPSGRQTYQGHTDPNAYSGGLP